jgi:predicted kinase
MKVTILRGLPGSGKSPLARRLRRAGASVVSADDYFHLPAIGVEPRPETAPGSYVFNPAELGFAHARCFRLFIEAIQAGKDVVVDNTNTTAQEISPYVLGAQAYGARVEIVQVVGTVEASLKYQSHGVSEAGLQAMAARLAVPLPPWWPVALYHPNHDAPEE